MQDQESQCVIDVPRRMWHTCVTGAGLRRVAAVGQVGALIIAIGGRVLAVELWGESCSGISSYSGGSGTATFDHLSVLEVLLEPRGNDALHCVRHSADQPGLLGKEESQNMLEHLLGSPATK